MITRLIIVLIVAGVAAGAMAALRAVQLYRENSVWGGGSLARSMWKWTGIAALLSAAAWILAGAL